MNGIRLLVLISFFNQVALAQTPQSVPGERDYGWQISPEDKVLEYIVQLSPETVSLMQATNQENASDMPPELVGRATRTVVRIGTSILPRTPSLAEIARTPRFNTPADLNAALNDGRFSDLESDAVVNVQGNGSLPPLPDRSGISNSLSDLQGNVIDNAARAASQLQANNQAASQLGNQFLNGASGGAQPNRDLLSGGLPSTGGSNFPNTTPPNSSLPNTPPPNTTLPNTGQSYPSLPGGNSANAGMPNSGMPSTGFPGTGNTGKFKETAPDNRGYPEMAGNAGGADPLGTQNWQGTTNRTADNRALPGFPSDANAASGWPGNASDPMSLNYENTNSAPRSNGGFGVPPGGQIPGRSLADAIGQNGNYNSNSANAGYPNGSYTGTGYPQSTAPLQPGLGGNGLNGGGNVGVGNPNGGIDRIASNPNAQPAGAVGELGAKSPGDVNSEGAAKKPSRSAENFLQVFFLLSLVVNFYLAMLIRKLLTRYRSLLSSVRSQTA